MRCHALEIKNAVLSIELASTFPYQSYTHFQLGLSLELLFPNKPDSETSLQGLSIEVSFVSEFFLKSGIVFFFGFPAMIEVKIRVEVH